MNSSMIDKHKWVALGASLKWPRLLLGGRKAGEEPQEYKRFDSWWRSLHWSAFRRSRNVIRLSLLVSEPSSMIQAKFKYSCKAPGLFPNLYTQGYHFNTMNIALEYGNIEYFCHCRKINTYKMHIQADRTVNKRWDIGENASQHLIHEGRNSFDWEFLHIQPLPLTISPFC